MRSLDRDDEVDFLDKFFVQCVSANMRHTGSVMSPIQHTTHPVQQRHREVTRHVAPTTVEGVLAVLDEVGPGARLIAGGTDLLLELSRGTRAGINTLVDITRVTDFESMSCETTSGSGSMVHVGPLTTHGDVISFPGISGTALPLAQACLEVGSPQLRNRATVVGNVATASPANDTISALIALGASVTLASLGGTRNVDLADFYTGFRSTDIAHGELITRISFRATTKMRRGIFVKLGLRSAQAISVVHVSAVVEHDEMGVVEDLVLALGSVAPTVTLVPGAADLARGRQLADVARSVADLAAASVTPIDDLRATAEYRNTTLPTMIERALDALSAGAETASWPARSPRLVADKTAAARGAIDAGAVSEVSCTINGVAAAHQRAVGKTLLDWLRDDAGLTGTKEGCAEGECGACTVHLDGKAVLACLVPAASATNSVITTIEGIVAPDGARESLHPVQAAFDDCGGVQCGFCTPGFIMSAVALTAELADPTRQEIELGLAGNLCRCTGYYSIIEAVMTSAGEQA